MHVITILPGFIDELHVNVEDIEFNISVQSIARLMLKPLFQSVTEFTNLLPVTLYPRISHVHTSFI